MPRIWDLFVWGVALSVGLVGCVNSVEYDSAPVPTPAGETRQSELESFDEIPESTLPRKLEVSLTLSSPNDLRVKPGQEVKAGQVLSDRSEERKRLEERRNLLQISLKSLEFKPQPPAPLQPVPPVPILPGADFSNEEASVSKASLVMEQSNKAVQMQQEKITALAAIPNIPEAVLEHETAKLGKIIDKLKLDRAEYQQAIARF
ncbi:MAG: hypothetical protein AB4426_03545 [Xenococcaceae cyanobacterium]